MQYEHFGFYLAHKYTLSMLYLFTIRTKLSGMAQTVPNVNESHREGSKKCTEEKVSRQRATSLGEMETYRTPYKYNAYMYVYSHGKFDIGRIYTGCTVKRMATVKNARHSFQSIHCIYLLNKIKIAAPYWYMRAYTVDVGDRIHSRSYITCNMCVCVWNEMCYTIVAVSSLSLSLALPLKQIQTHNIH